MHFIGEASSGDAVGHASAINKRLAAADGAAASPLAAAGMWTDAFYTNTAAQLLTCVTSWGWTVAMLAVPGVLIYHTISNVRGALKGLMPAGPAGADGGDGEGGDPDERAAKRKERFERKNALAMKRAKGVRNVASGAGMTGAGGAAR